jgi:hypothetical protein
MIGPGLQRENWRWSGLIDLAEGSGILAGRAFHPLKLPLQAYLRAMGRGKRCLTTDVWRDQLAIQTFFSNNN